VIRSHGVKATKTLAARAISGAAGKTGIDKLWVRPVFRPFFRLAEASEATLPGSSVAEQVTVNHLVEGSIPSRAAIIINDFHSLGLLFLRASGTLRLHFGSH
jgi:hypothetical protein